MNEITEWKFEHADEFGAHYICPTCGRREVVKHYWRLPTTCPKCKGAERRSRQNKIEDVMRVIDEICRANDIEITSEDTQSLMVIKDNQNGEEYIYDGRLRWK